MKLTKRSTQRGRKPRDLCGQTFGRLTVIAFAGRSKMHRFWKCKCECGGHLVTRSDNLLRGLSKSCGCANLGAAARRTHGQTYPRPSPEYYVWSAMIQRCTNPSNRDFGNYGGRGIRVCERWRNSFADFFAAVGLRPSPRHTLDRYPDNDGDYKPGNVRWATYREQAENKRPCKQRRKIRLLTINGETLSVSAWASRYGVSPELIHGRLRSGWKADRAVTTKPGK